MKKKRSRGQHGPRVAPRACGPDVWDVSAWCAQMGIGQSTFYTLELKPQAVRLGRHWKIHESPGEYARRIAAMQAEKQAA